MLRMLSSTKTDKLSKSSTDFPTHMRPAFGTACLIEIFNRLPWAAKNYINPDKELHKSHWRGPQQDKVFSKYILGT